MDPTKLYTTREAGEILGITGRTVRRWARTGRLQAINLTEGDGKAKLRIHADELQRFIDDQTLDESA